MIAILLLCSAASAFEILSQFTNVYVKGGSNDILSVNNTITIRCSINDYGTTQTITVANKLDNSTQHTVTITCGVPKHIFSFNQIGVVPRNGTLVTSRACELETESSQGSGILSTQPSVATSNNGGARRLLGFWDVAGGLAGSWAQATVGDYVRCQIPGLDSGCRNDAGLQDDITNLHNMLDSLNESQTGLKKAIVDEMNARLSQDNLTMQEFYAIQRTLQDNQYTVGNLSIQADNTFKLAQFNRNEHLSAMKKFNEFRDTTDTRLVNQEISSILLKRQVTELTNWVNSDLQSIVWNITSMIDTVQANQRTATTQIVSEVSRSKAANLRVLDYIRDVVGLVQDVRQRTSVKRLLTRTVLDIIAFTLPQLGLSPFLDYKGQRGSGDGLWYLLVERFHVTKFINVAASVVAQETVFNFYCRVDEVISRLTGWNTIRDFLQRTGPSNCSVANFSCTCYIGVTTRICNPVAPSPTSAWHTAGGVLQNSDCAATPVATSTTIVTPDQFYNRVYDDCRVAAFNSTFGRAYVHLDRVGVSVGTTVDTSRCTTDPETLATAFGDGTFSVGQAFVNLFPVAVSKSRTVIGQVLDEYDGIIPNDLSYLDTPFIRLGGAPASCLEASFMAFDGRFLPLVAMEFDRSSVEVSVVVDGVLTVATDVTLGPDTDVGIPSGFLTVGFPNVTSEVYDTEPSDLSTSPMESAQKGKVTYAAASSASAWSLAKWKTRTGSTFDHYAASNVAALYRRDVVNGICAGGAITEGSWCSRLRNWRVSPLDLSRVAFEPRLTDSYTLTIGIPQGDIYSQRFPACPSISIISSNPTGKTVSMLNRQTTPMDVTVLIRGGCVKNYEYIRIDPNTEYHLFVPACSNPNLKLQTAAVYYWKPTGDVSTDPCGNKRYDVTTDYSQEIVAPFALADTGYVRTTTVATVDATNLALAEIMQRVTQTMADLALAQLKIFVEMGIPVNGSSLQEIQKILLSGSLSADEIFNITNRYRVDYNSTQELIDYETRTQVLIDKGLLASNLTKKSMENSIRDLANAGSTLALLANATLAEAEASRRLAAAELRYIDVQQNFSYLLVKTLTDIARDLNTNDPGNIFSFLFGGMAGLIGGCASGDGVCGLAAELVKTIAKEVGKVIELPFKLLGGIADFFVNIVITVVISVVASAFVSVAVYKWMERRKGRGRGDSAELYRQVPTASPPT